MFPIRDHNPSGRWPFVTQGLMLLNVGVFLLYWLPMPSEIALARFFFDWGLVPARISDGQGWETFLTSMFLHGGWLHLIGNMLFLHIFGDNLEDEMGHLGFLGFYLASGVAAAWMQYLAEPQSIIPMVGASGAIAGVMGGYLLMFPRARVDVLFVFVIFFRILPVAAWIMLCLWFGIQIVSGVLTPADMGGVAYWAHAGGFLAGVALCMPLWLRRGGTEFWTRTKGLPPHPDAAYRLAPTRIPKVRRGGRGPWG